MCSTMSGSWGWMMPLGFALTIGFWGLVAWGAFHLIRGGGWRARPMPPEDELAQRFGRGDIDAAEYHERLDTSRNTTGESGHRVGGGAHGD